MSRFHLLNSIAGSRANASTDDAQSSATASTWLRVRQYLVYPRSLITGAIIIAIACIASIVRIDTTSSVPNTQAVAPSVTSAKADDELMRFAWTTGERASSSGIEIVLGNNALRIEQTGLNASQTSAIAVAQISYANLFYLLLVGSFAVTVLSQNKERHWRGKTSMV
jgi:hypothetical protein